MKKKIAAILVVSVIAALFMGSTAIRPSSSADDLPADIRHTIDVLNATPPGNPFAHLSKEEVQRALDYGGSTATEAFFRATGETEAVPLPIITEEDLNNVDQISNEPDISYDPDTGITTILP